VCGIMRTGCLAMPGDTVVEGIRIGIRDGHVLREFECENKHTGARKRFRVNPNQIFLSPAIAYSALSQYAAAAEYVLRPVSVCSLLKLCCEACPLFQDGRIPPPARVSSEDSAKHVQYWPGDGGGDCTHRRHGHRPQQQVGMVHDRRRARCHSVDWAPCQAHAKNRLTGASNRSLCLTHTPEWPT
jgi:hypothetical protein